MSVVPGGNWLACLVALLVGALSVPAQAHAATSPHDLRWSLIGNTEHLQTGQALSFKASASDDDHDIATYSWDFDGDGVIDTSSASASTTHTYDQAGVYTVVLTVTDATGLAAREHDQPLTIRDHWPPSAELFAPDGGYLHTGRAASFTLQAHSTDQSITAPVDTRIDWGDGSPPQTVATAGLANTAVTHAYAAHGRYRVHYTATDRAGALSTTGPSLPVTVADNQLPIGLGWSAPGAQPGQPVGFTATARDLDGTIVSYEWDWDGDGQFDESTGSSPDATHTFDLAGTYTVGLRVTDNDGATQQQWGSVQVMSSIFGPEAHLQAFAGPGANGGAYPTELRPGGRPLSVATTVISSATVDSYTYDWGDGTSTGPIADRRATHVYTHVGDYWPRVTAALSDGTTMVAALEADTSLPVDHAVPAGGPVTVRDNFAPAHPQLFAQLSAQCLRPGYRAVYVLDAFDGDGIGIDHYDIDWDGDRTFDELGAAAVENEATLRHAFAHAGDYYPVVRAVDGDGAATEVTAGHIDIPDDNCLPYAKVTPTPDRQARTGRAFTLDASASHDDDGAITSYAWDLDGDGSFEQTGPTATANYPTDGLHGYTLRLIDDRHGATYYDGAVTTTSTNQPPYAADVTPSRRSVQVGDTVYVTAGAFDPDGTITAYRWDFDGDGSVDLTTTRPTASHVYATTGSFRLGLTVVDDDGASASLPFGPFVDVARAGPRVLHFDRSPAEPHPGDTVTLTALATSVNGPIEHYQWTGGETTEPRRQYTFDHAGDYDVGLTMRDATGVDGLSATTIAVRDHWAPHAAFSVSPSCAPASATVSYDASATTDSDSDTSSLRYHWVFSDGVTRDTSSPRVQRRLRDHTLTATLTVSDGDGQTSAPVAHDVTAPIGPRCDPTDVAFTSTTDGLTATFTPHASDFEGDIVGYRFQWGDGGSSPWTTQPATHTYAEPGTYNVGLLARDDEGNSAGTTQTITVGIDDEPPVVSITSPAGPATTQTPPAFSGRASEAADVVLEYFAGEHATGTPVRSVTRTRSGDAWSAPADPSLPDGTYTVTAHQRDAAGNVGYSNVRTFTLDTVGPAPSLNAVGRTSARPTVTGHGGTAPGDDTTVAIAIYPGTDTSGTPAQTLSGFVNLGLPQLGEIDESAGPLPSGVYTAVVTQGDAAGNHGTSAPMTFTVDATEPTGLAVDTPADNALVRSRAPLVTGRAGDAVGDSGSVAVDLFDDDLNLVQTVTTTRSGTTWQATLGPDLADGVYHVRVRQSDDVGNGGSTVMNRFTLDATAPQPTLSIPGDRPSSYATAPAFGGTAGSAAGDAFSVDLELYAGTTVSGRPVQSVEVSRNGNAWSAPPLTLADGTYTARAVQQDEAGNSGVSAAWTFTVAGPVVTASLTPTATAPPAPTPTATATPRPAATATPSVRPTVTPAPKPNATPIPIPSLDAVAAAARVPQAGKLKLPKSGRLTLGKPRCADACRLAVTLRAGSKTLGKTAKSAGASLTLTLRSADRKRVRRKPLAVTATFTITDSGGRSRTLVRRYALTSS